MAGVTVRFNLNLNKLPVCPCGNGDLLPLEDFARDNTSTYLKGWFCPTCKKYFYFKSGEMIEGKVQEAI